MESQSQESSDATGESIDLCIQDTQGAGYDMLIQQTQVDDGFSDKDEGADQNFDDMYGSTQVDEDYFTRMLENENDDKKELRASIEHNTNNLEYKESSQGTEETGDEVDFCIADTQAPGDHANLLEPKDRTSPYQAAAVQASDEDKVVVNASTYMQESHVTVYDYLSLSAPMSMSDGVQTTTSALIQSTPVFSALESTTIEAAPPVVTVRPASTAPGEQVVEEEEPTQLDGSHDSPFDTDRSSRHGPSGSSERKTNGTSSTESHVSPMHCQQVKAAVLQSRAGESETFVSPPPSAEKDAAWRAERRSNSSTSSGTNAVQRMDAFSNKQVPVRSSVASATAQQGPGQLPAGAATQRSETDSNSALVTDWISAKSGNPAHLSSSAPYSLPETIAAPPDAVTIGSPVLTTAAPALSDRSLDELLQMQEELQLLIQSKAAKHGGALDASVQQLPQEADRAVKDSATHTAAGVDATTVACMSTTVVPLQRQDTSYGMSQPSNAAVSGLLRLREADPSSATTAPSTTVAAPSSSTVAPTAKPSPLSPAVPKHTTFSPFLYNSNGGNKGLAVAASADATTASAASTPSPGNRKFFKRKFASGRSPLPPTAAAATSSTSAAAAAGMAWDDDEDERSGALSDASGVESPASPTRSTAVASSSSRTDVGRASTSTPSSRAGQNSRGKARKVIRDTQDDENGNANMGSEAEFNESDFLDTQDPTLKSIANAVVPAEASHLPADIPTSFLRELPESFTELWHALVGLNWFWKRGGGIVSYYYVRPSCQVKKGYLMGRDYFGDEEDVMLFVRTIVTQCRDRLGIAPPVKKAPSEAAGATTAAVEEVVAGGGEAPRDKGESSGHRDTTGTSSTTSATPSAAAPARALQSSQPSGVSSPAAMAAVVGDPVMRDINRIPWKHLWKMLRDRDWTWDFGSQLSNYYFAPGFGIKSPDAVIGVNKFDSEEAVRRFIKRQKWPEFHSNVPGRQASLVEDSQPLDAHLHDPSWQLSSHRKKRKKRGVAYAEDTAVLEAEEVSVAGSEQQQGGAERGKKKQRSDARNAAQVASAEGNSCSTGSIRSTVGVAPTTSTTGSTGRPPVAPSGRATARLASQSDDYGAATQPQLPLQSKHSPARHSDQGVYASSSSSSGGNQRRLFAGQRYVISGVPEKLKSQLTKDITKRGGTILPFVPVDGNESQHDPIVLDEKTGERGVKGPVVVVSHPGEFRKPNYLMALATGVALVHYQWVRDSMVHSALQVLADYLLPSGCAALHSYNIFARPDRTTLLGTPDPLSNAILANVKVLNFAGSGWDNLLLASGATTVQKSAGLVQGIGNGPKPGRGAGARRPVDLILIDPNEYAQTVTALKLPPTHTSTSRQAVGRYSTPNSLLMHLGGTPTASSSSGTPKSPNLKMGEDDLAAVQRCLRLHSSQNSEDRLAATSTAAPLLVTTDWLVHSIAVGHLLDCDILDIFTLPRTPEKQPFTYKADAVTGTGERYTKYDIVFYSTSTATTCNSKDKNHSATPGQDASLSVGKILEFVRRDLRSPLYARIRPLVTAAPAALPLETPAQNADMNGKVLTGDPGTPVRLVEVDKLAGKAVLLASRDFLRVSRYSLSDPAVYCAAPEWHVENPSILAGEEEEADRESEGGMQAQEEPLLRGQRSQDY